MDDRRVIDITDELDEFEEQEKRAGSGSAVADAVRGLQEATKGRRISMYADHPEMDEHVALVQRKVREMAGVLLDERALTAAITVGTKIAFELVTPAGQIIDAVLTVKLDAKPQKAEN